MALLLVFQKCQMKQPILSWLRSSFLQPLHSVNPASRQPQVKPDEGVDPAEIFSMKLLWGDARRLQEQEWEDTVMPLPAFPAMLPNICMLLVTRGLLRTARSMLFLALEAHSSINMVLQGTRGPKPVTLLSAFITFCHRNTCLHWKWAISTSHTPLSRTKRCIDETKTSERFCASIHFSILPALFTWAMC